MILHYGAPLAFFASFAATKDSPTYLEGLGEQRDIQSHAICNFITVLPWQKINKLPLLLFFCSQHMINLKHFEPNQVLQHPSRCGSISSFANQIFTFALPHGRIFKLSSVSSAVLLIGYCSMMSDCISVKGDTKLTKGLKS